MGKDGNCFCRALGVALGHGKESYHEIKKLLRDYLLSNRKVFSYLGKLEPLANRIRTEGEAADYEVIRLAAEFFQRTIHLFRQQYPSTTYEAFKNDSGPRQGPPLKILFQGEWQYGHFLAIMPKA